MRNGGQQYRNNNAGNKTNGTGSSYGSPPPHFATPQHYPQMHPHHQEMLGMQWFTNSLIQIFLEFFYNSYNLWRNLALFNVKIFIQQVANFTVEALEVADLAVIKLQWV